MMLAMILSAVNRKCLIAKVHILLGYELLCDCIENLSGIDIRKICRRESTKPLKRMRMKPMLLKFD